MNSKERYINEIKEKHKFSKLTDLYAELKTANWLLTVFHIIGVSLCIATYFSIVYNIYSLTIFGSIFILLVASVAAVGQTSKKTILDLIDRKTNK